jgi:hypothetical protein
LKHYNQLYLGT